MADVFTTIKHCALFEGFSELEILSILSELGYSIKGYPAGETVYHDDLDKSGGLGCVYLILEGEVSLALLRDTVLEHQLRILKAGSMFGVVLAFSKIPHIAYSYRTLSETVLMRIPVSFFGPPRPQRRAPAAYPRAFKFFEDHRGQGGIPLPKNFLPEIFDCAGEDCQIPVRTQRGHTPKPGIHTLPARQLPGDFQGGAFQGAVRDAERGAD